jgi:hypothetical protein
MTSPKLDPTHQHSSKTSLELKMWATEQIVALHTQQMITVDKVVADAEKLVEYVTGVKHHG